MGLGVEHDALGHVEVGGGVDVDVAVADAGLDHRHRRLLDHRRDQPGASARDEHVDQPAGPHQLLDRVVALARHELDDVLGKAGLQRRATQHRHDRRVGAPRARGTAQQHRVAALQADAGGIGGDVGTGLVDDPDDAERHPHLAQLQAVGQGRAAQHLADGVRQRRPRRAGPGPSPRAGRRSRRSRSSRCSGVPPAALPRRRPRWPRGSRSRRSAGRRPSPRGRRPWRPGWPGRARWPPRGHGWRPRRRRCRTCAQRIQRLAELDVRRVRPPRCRAVAEVLLEDLETDDLPVGQVGGLAVLVPQAHGQGGDVEHRLALVPELDLDGLTGGDDRVEERALLVEALHRPADDQRLHRAHPRASASRASDARRRCSLVPLPIGRYARFPVSQFQLLSRGRTDYFAHCRSPRKWRHHRTIRSSRCTTSRSYAAPSSRASSRVDRPSRPGSSFAS